MDEPEYLRIPINLIPKEFIDECKLDGMVIDGHIHDIVQNGMHGLPQSGLIANELSRKRLELHGYYETSTLGLWKYQSRDTYFTLIVDDFGVKIINNEDANHLIETLEKYYAIEVD